MKKLGIISAVVAAIVLLSTSLIFMSCGKTAANENGWYVDVKEATEAAKKEKNNILIIATMDGDDLFSSDLINNVLKNSNFKNEICSEYTVLVTDFSKSSFGATAINENSTKEEIEIAEEKADIMQRNAMLAANLGVDITPEIYIMSKEMYFIKKVDLISEHTTNYEAFKELIENQKTTVEEFNAKVEKTEKGSKTEKLAAIDDIYESTDVYFRMFLVDLIEKYIKIDSDNESGLLNKYLVAKADIESSDYYMAGDAENAVKVYKDVAEDLRLTPEQRQNCYYLAAYVMILTGSTDFDEVMNNLQKAIDICPEGANTPSIKMVLEGLKNEISTSMEFIQIEPDEGNSETEVAVE